jgi:iron(III) transport system substrate-binding protein
MMPAHRIRTTAAAFASLLALAAADLAHAQGPNFSSVVTNAEKEGKVVFLTTFPGSELTIPAAFQKAYPHIKVEAQRIQTIDAIPRLDQEAAINADGTDVALISGEDWFIAKSAAGRLTPPIGPQVKRWESTPYWKKNYVVAAVLPMVFGFNTSKVKPFTDWNGFLAPALKGKFGICDTEGAPVIAYNDWIRTTHSDDFLQKLLHEQKPVVFRNTSAAAQALAAGEIDAAECMTPGALEPLMKQGAPVAFTVPTPGFGLVGAVGITSWAKRPNAAQVFMNWLMSDEGQNALIEGVGLAASPVGAHKSAALDIRSLHAWDASQYTPARYGELRAQFARTIGQH